MLSPAINDKGEISVEGHLIGTIDGFRFSLAKSDGDTDAKGLRAAAANAVAPEIRNRAERLSGAPNEEIVLATDGYVRWRGEIVAELAEGNDIFSPRILILADESLTGPDLDRVQDRLNLWLRHLVNTQLEQILGLREPAELEGTARGIAFQLSEHLGLLPRTAVADEVKSLDQDVRGKMRKLGIKFGAYHIYLPLSLKPAPRELALILWALKNGGIRQPGVSDLPHTILSGRTSFEVNPEIDRRLYEVAGFKLAGNRAVRIDILERLADIIRPLIALDPSRVQGELPAGAADKNGFRVTVEMTSLLGCAGEDFASILKSLGYRLQRTPIETPVAGADEVADLTKLDGETPPAGDAEATAETPVEAVDLADAAKLDVAEAAPGETTAAAPEAETVPEEQKFDEVWFPGSRRPDANRHQRRPAARGQDGQAQQDKPHEGRGKPHHGKPRPKSNGSRDSHNGPRDNARDNRPRNAPPPRKEKPFDPDSPFAALAALRDQKPK